MTTDNKEYATGLRQAADFYEAHPEVPLPETQISNYAVDSREEAEKIMRALGSCTKQYSENMFTLSKNLGPVKLVFYFTRANICTRKVVAVETIPAKYIEAHVEPARTKEIYEWDCGPVLAGAQDA